MPATFESSTDPLGAFTQWFEEAQSRSDNADVVALATASSDGMPAVRFVNYKGMQEGALTFYTNHDSRKGEQLASNPRAAMVFHWAALRRQVTLEGTCGRLRRVRSEEYFTTRDRETQITAWASDQSRALDSFETFEARLEQVRARFADREIPCPDHWGGYGLTPMRIEFRVSGEHRRHRRWLYVRDGAAWTMTQLYP